MNIWAAKSLLKFASTAHRMHQSSYWSSPTCWGCLSTPEHDTHHIFLCSSPELIKKRDEIYVDLENFIYSESPDHDLSLLLTSIFTNSPLPYVPPHLLPLRHSLHTFGHRNLWHRILPQSLCKLIFSFGHNGNRWVQQLIQRLLNLHNELWRFRCTIIHAKLLSHEYIENILWLWHRINFVRTSLPHLIPQGL